MRSTEPRWVGVAHAAAPGLEWVEPAEEVVNPRSCRLRDEGRLDAFAFAFEAYGKGGVGTCREATAERLLVWSFSWINVRSNEVDRWANVEVGVEAIEVGHQIGVGGKGESLVYHNQ